MAQLANACSGDRLKGAHHMSVNHRAVLERVLDALKNTPDVQAVATYGSTAARQWAPESDLDLILILSDEAPVNGVHVFVDSIPIDMSLKSYERWVNSDVGWLPPDGITPEWDPHDVLKHPPQTPRPTEAAEHFRYAHRHRLFKLQRWMRDDADVADLLAAGATHWIAVSYFHARGMRFPGIDQCVTYWREHDPEMVDLLIRAAKDPEDRLARVTLASEKALAPIGGLWQDTEVFITGWDGPPTVDEARRAKALLAPVLSLVDQ